MKVYSITYDLKAPDRDYEGVYREIKATGKWWHYLESTWLVVSNETSKQISDRLFKSIDKNDYLLIIEVRSDYYGNLPKAAWEWIKEHVPS